MTYTSLSSVHPRYLISRIGDSSADSQKAIQDIQDKATEKCFTISNGFPEAYAKQFSKGGVPLNRAEMNSIFNLLTQLHFYWQMGGTPVWDSRIATGQGAYASLNGYPKNARIFHIVDGQLTEFLSLVDNNSVTPSKEAKDYWKVVTLGSDAVTEKRLQEVSGYLSSYTKSCCDSIASDLTTKTNALSGRIDTLSADAASRDNAINARVTELSGVVEGLPKGVKVLDVVSDKTTVAEILQETGHGTETFNSGDILIVTNAAGIKSAYVYMVTTEAGKTSGWVACNGKFDASKVILTANIDLAGNYTSIGNLNKGATSAVVSNKFVAGDSIQKVITDLLDQVVNPSRKSYPSNSVELRNGSSTGTLAGEVEVGSYFTPWYKVTYADGKFTCVGKDTNAGCISGSVSVSDSLGNEKTATSGTIYSQFKAGDGSKDTGGMEQGIQNYKISSAKTSYGAATTVPNDNKGNPYPAALAEIPASDTASAYSGTVVGVRHMYWGMCADKFSKSSAPASSNVRALIHHKKTPGASTITPDDHLKASEVSGAKCCIVAIPDAANMKIKEVLMPSSQNADVTTSFEEVSGGVMVEGANSYPAKKYKVWVYSPASLDEKETYKITIGAV